MFTNPIGSMYGIFTNIYPINHPNVSNYTSTMEHLGMDFLIRFPSCHRHARTEGLRTIHFNSTACVASQNFVARLKANLWFWNILDIVYYGKSNSKKNTYVIICIHMYLCNICNGVYISVLSSNAFKRPGGTNTSPRRYMPVANCQRGPIGLANIRNRF